MIRVFDRHYRRRMAFQYCRSNDTFMADLLAFPRYIILSTLTFCIRRKCLSRISRRVQAYRPKANMLAIHVRSPMRCARRYSAISLRTPNRGLFQPHTLGYSAVDTARGLLELLSDYALVLIKSPERVPRLLSQKNGELPAEPILVFAQKTRKF